MISRILGNAEAQAQEGDKRASRVYGLAGVAPVSARESLEMGTQMNHLLTRTDASVAQDHWAYNIIWFAVNALLLFAICFFFYTMTWEYSTRRYLKGFSDAVVPALATPEEKITAILSWMARGPARLPLAPEGKTQDRDPTDTLNYESLLKVCGSATNGFINLADSSGLSARRLLLLDNDRGAKHVVAEVLLDGQWIVVDPSFRTILRGASGQLLTRHDLADPSVFSIATQDIPHYDPSYNYVKTGHVHLARIPLVGASIQWALDRYLPGWADSPIMSLLFERESLAAVVTSLVLLLFVFLLRFSLRWYGEVRLGIQTIGVRRKFHRAMHVLFSRAV
jgi:hypothetical protein